MRETLVVIALAACIVLSALSFDTTAAGPTASDEIGFSVSGSGSNTVHVHQLDAPSAGRVDYDVRMQYLRGSGPPQQAFALLVPESAVGTHLDLWTSEVDLEHWFYQYNSNAPFTKVGVDAMGENLYYTPDGFERMYPLFLPSERTSLIEVSPGPHLLVLAATTDFTYTARFTNLTLVESREIVTPIQRYSLQEGHFEGISAQADILGVPLVSVASQATLAVATTSPGFFFVEVTQGSRIDGNVTFTRPDGVEIPLLLKWHVLYGVFIGGMVGLGPKGGIYQTDLLTGMQGMWNIDVELAAGHFFDIAVVWVPFE